MLFGMAEMLEFVYTQRREDLIKVNDIVNFIYKSSHICRSCYILFCLDFVACSVVVVALLLTNHLPSGSLLTKCYSAGNHIASVGIILTSGLDFSVHHARTRTVCCNRPVSV